MVDPELIEEAKLVATSEEKKKLEEIQYKTKVGRGEIAAFKKVEKELKKQFDQMGNIYGGMEDDIHIFSGSILPYMK